MRCGPGPPFILIWGWALTVWSTLTGLDWESNWGLLLGFCNQALASYIVMQSICFIGRNWVVGVVKAIKRQTPHPPTHPSNITAVPPSSDPVPGDQAKPSFDTECLTVVVNVLGEQLKSVHWGFKGPQYENDLCCYRADPTAQQSFGAQWAGIQVQVIAGWIWDRRLGQMWISLTLWSEDQEAFIA